MSLLLEQHVVQRINDVLRDFVALKTIFPYEYILVKVVRIVNDEALYIRGVSNHSYPDNFVGGVVHFHHTHHFVDINFGGDWLGGTIHTLYVGVPHSV